MLLPLQLSAPLGLPSVILMATPYDSTALLALIRQMARAPAATAPGWADADLFRLVNTELLTGLGAQVLKARQEHFVTSKDYALTAGTDAYALPSRAAYGKVREVHLVASDGTHKNLPQRGVESVHGRDTTSNNGTPVFHYFRGNSIVLVPAPDASTYTTLRVWYFRRPSRMVATSEALLVDDVSPAPTYTGTGALTTSNGELDVDIINAEVPHTPAADDVTPFAMGSGSVTFSASRTDVEAGTYVAEAGESPVFQLPPEFFTVLARRVANAMLRSGGDADGLAMGESELKQMEADAFGVLFPDRNEGDSEAISVTRWD